MGDIISLYEASKPYPQQVQAYIKNQYTQLQKCRISFLQYTVPPAALYLFSSFNINKSQTNTFRRSKLQVFGKTLLGFAGAHFFYEAYLWNNYLAKLYLIQRQKLYYS